MRCVENSTKKSPMPTECGVKTIFKMEFCINFHFIVMPDIIIVHLWRISFHILYYDITQIDTFVNLHQGIFIRLYFVTILGTKHNADCIYSIILYFAHFTLFENYWNIGSFYQWFMFLFTLFIAERNTCGQYWAVNILPVYCDWHYQIG